MLPTIKIHFERWRWNPKYELWVSTEGRVRDRYKQEVRFSINQKGYMRVYSEVLDKRIYLHRLVLETWRPKTNSNILTVEHIDNNKRHNSVRNLMWMTEEENLDRGKEVSVYEAALKRKETDCFIANGVAMSLEEIVTFIYRLPGTAGQYSKKQVEEKITETINNKKEKKQIFGVTLEEVI